MRLKITKSAKSTRLYAIKSTYDPKTKKTSSKIVYKLGTAEEIMEKQNISYDEAIKWAKNEIANMTKDEKKTSEAQVIRFRPTYRIDKNTKRKVCAGYLFPLKIMSELKLESICQKISKDQNFDFDLGEILQYLVAGRIICPSSKLSTYKWCQSLINPPEFSQHQIYRALSVLAKNSDKIQAFLFKSSQNIRKRHTGVLYYDCTNYFFEIEKADNDGDRQYGLSKEHRPNPIVQMGLFMDADGIPLAFRITPGNQSEQTTLKPLEKTIINEFGKSKFVVCTDAGLSSSANKLFNTQGKRAFICAQSIKKMKSFMREWVLDKNDWILAGTNKKYNLDEIDEIDYMNKIFYKERWVVDDNDFCQRYIVMFCPKYKYYQQSIRQTQINRAQTNAQRGKSACFKKNPNDPNRFLSVEHYTSKGEIAKKSKVSLDEAKVEKEALYDGLSCIATSLEDSPEDIIAINKRRWQIEECFRIMKTEFRARPVYLSLQDRIQGHFLTCFISLLVYRLLEDRLGYSFSCEQILQTLRNMDMLEISGEGWIPAYTRDDITDALHDAFGFHTDYEIVTNQKMRTILTKAKK